MRRVGKSTGHTLGAARLSGWGGLRAAGGGDDADASLSRRGPSDRRGLGRLVESWSRRLEPSL